MPRASTAKPPVAGQRGYDLNRDESLPTPVEQRDAELGPAAIPVKPKREAAVSPVKSRDGKAKDLLDHLIETGTNPQKLADAKLWIEDNADASAEKFYRYLESAEDIGHAPIAVGTLTKAGKWLWGATWAPETAVFQAPSDEIKKLREQVSALEQQIGAKNAELAGLKHQLAHVQDRNAALGSQVDFLKVGKSNEELTSAGVNVGHNALTGANAV